MNLFLPLWSEILFNQDSHFLVIAFLPLGAGFEAALAAGLAAGLLGAAFLDVALVSGLVDFAGFAALGATAYFVFSAVFYVVDALVDAPDSLALITSFFLSLSFLAADSLAFLVWSAFWYNLRCF